MSNLIIQAEQKLGLNSTQCPLFLGVSKGKWSEWKTEKRDTPEYVIRSIEAHMRLNKREIDKLKKSRLDI